MKHDPHRDENRRAAPWALQITTNLVLLPVLVGLGRRGLVVHGVTPKVRRQSLPTGGRVAQRCEERGLEPADRMRVRKQVVTCLGGADNRSIYTREPHRCPFIVRSRSSDFDSP